MFRVTASFRSELLASQNVGSELSVSRSVILDCNLSAERMEEESRFLSCSSEACDTSFRKDVRSTVVVSPMFLGAACNDDLFLGLILCCCCCCCC